MSYRDPKQYIDTQSMQIQQNLQKTLANVGSQTVANVNKIHEENAKKVEEIRAAADARVEKAQNSIIQTQSKNPTADFGDLQPQLSRMNAILLKDPTKRTAAEKTFVTSMSSIGDTMANSLKNTAMAQEVMIEQANKKPGTMGAIDAKANPGLYAKLSILANRTEGRTVARYKTNENGQVVFSIDVYEKGSETPIGSVINDNVGTTQMPDIIPDVNKEMNEFITNTINSVDPTSKLSPVLDNEKNILYYKDSMGRRVDPAKFRKKLEGESVGALAGYTSREIKSLFNNVLKGKDDTEFSYDEGLTDDERDLANERFVDYMMNQGSVKKVLGNIVEETIPSKTKLPKELTFSEKIKLSERENKIEAFNKAVGENLAKPSISAVSSFDGNLMAVIREDADSGQFGWMLQRKDGTKWVDIANSLKDDISKLSVQLGYGDPDIITEDESVIFKNQPYNENKFNKYKI
jgi:rhodanese-related sulfurtransferase